MTADEQQFVELLKKGMGDSPFDDANIWAYADHGWNRHAWRTILPRLIPKLKTRKDGSFRYGVGNSPLITKLLADLWTRGHIGGEKGWYRMDVNHGPAHRNDPP